MDHTYSGKHAENIQNDRPIDRYTRQFQPLMGLTINFDNGISSTVRMSHTLTMNRNEETGRSRATSQQITASLGYQHRGGLTIPLPFFNDIKLQNTVNLNLDFDFTKNSTEAIKGEGEDYTTQSWSNKWSVTPRITYTFSDKLTGGFHIAYEEHEDHFSGKRINRDFKFNVNIAIRGS